MKNSEEFVTCTRCNGSGVDENEVWLCNKCHGEGKLDWISNALDKPVHMSSLRLVDIKRATDKVKKIAEDCFPDIEKIYYRIDWYLKLLQSNRIIYQYVINRPLDNAFEVLMQPARTVEFVKVNLVINTGE